MSEIPCLFNQVCRNLSVCTPGKLNGVICYFYQATGWCKTDINCESWNEKMENILKSCILLKFTFMIMKLTNWGRVELRIILRQKEMVWIGKRILIFIELFVNYFRSYYEYKHWNLILIKFIVRKLGVTEKGLSVLCVSFSIQKSDFIFHVEDMIESIHLPNNKNQYLCAYSLFSFFFHQLWWTNLVFLNFITLFVNVMKLR